MAKKTSLKVSKTGPKEEKPVVSGPKYKQLNPKTTDEQNRLRAQQNFREAQNFKSNLTVGQKSVRNVSMGKAHGQQSSRSVTPQEVAKADSVITASRQYLQLGPKKKK